MEQQNSCFRCKKEKYKMVTFGVMEKHHYDNRTFDTDIDSGSTEYTSMGVYRIPLCKSCYIRMKISRYYILLLILWIGSFINLLASKEKDGAFGFSFFCFVLLIIGSVAVGKRFLVRNFLSDGMCKIMRKETTLSHVYSLDGDPTDIDIEDMPGSLSVRDWFLIYFVPESSMKKPVSKNRLGIPYIDGLNELRKDYAKINKN